MAGNVYLHQTIETETEQYGYSSFYSLQMMKSLWKESAMENFPSLDTRGRETMFVVFTQAVEMHFSIGSIAFYETGN